MKHLFINKNGKNTFILFHGTGGNEKSLIEISQFIDDKANILGLKGNVTENNYARFFRRFSEGNYDYKNIKDETFIIHNFIMESARNYGFLIENVILIGYSNGANIIQSLLKEYNEVYNNVILFHPANIFDDFTYNEKVNAFISASSNDELIRDEEYKKIINSFEEANYNINVIWTSNGHTLDMEEIKKSKEWYYRVLK